MARPPSIVVDASVVCKWFLPEAGTDAAVRLREAHTAGTADLRAPALLPYEVANVLRYRLTGRRDELPKAIDALYDAQIRMEPLGPVELARAAAFAVDSDLSVYDACYAAIALRLGGPLVTEDATLRSAVGNLGFRLSEWESAIQFGHRR